MQETIKQNEVKPVEGRNPRRAFFGQIFTAIGGGLLGGSLLNKILKSDPENHESDAAIKVTAHPLAVPRTKEGSKSHA
jgi:hypothetical protein